MKPDSFEQRIFRKFGRYGSEISEEGIAKVVDEVVLGNFERRSARRDLTGEWLVYAKYQGQNYYLSLALHDEGDQNILDRILEIERSQFPFLLSS